MSEDEWERRKQWELRRFIEKAEDMGSEATPMELLTFSYAWDRAGREMGIING